MVDRTSEVRDLGDGLVLRSVESPADVERVAAFDAHIHGEGSEATWRAWMTAHPHASQAHWLFVEAQGGRVVASLCLLPWRISYEGVELRSGEMGVVGTLEEYRGRGLQVALNRRFDELLRAGGYHLSHIQGIPYFYRQFGYEYALPLEAWWRLETSQAAALPTRGHTCRPATVADLPALARLYDEALAELDIGAVRDEAVWRYLLGPGLETETGAETWLVDDAAGAPAGYVRIARQGFGDGLIVAEASQLGYEAALAALQTIRRLTLERGKPFVRLNLPADCPLVAAARGLGAYDGSSYGWQVRVPDPPALLGALAPVLEGRIGRSMFAGLTRDVVISLYTSSLVLRFVGGRLRAVEAVGGGPPYDLRLPPPLLAPLLLGHRSLDEIGPMYPDAYAVAGARPLIDTLFQKRRGWLYMPY